MPPKPKRLKTTHRLTIFDLPVLDIMVDHVAPYLEFRDILRLRKCSRKSKILADEMFAGMWKLTINGEIRVLKSERELLKKCKRLRCIKIANLIWLTDEFLSELLTNNRLLVKVVICYCYNITTEGLLPLALHYRTLEYLALQNMWFGDEFLSAFPANGNKLEVLDISDNLKITTNSLRDFLAKQPHLKTIYMEQMNADLTPCLSTIANVCKDLHKLYINFNRINETEGREGLMSIANKCLQIRHMFFDTNEVLSGQFKKELYLKNSIVTKRPCDGLCDCGHSDNDTSDDYAGLLCCGQMCEMHTDANYYNEYRHW